MAASEWNSNSRASTISTLSTLLGFAIAFAVFALWFVHREIAQNIFPNFTPVVALGFMIFFIARNFLQRRSTYRIGQALVIASLAMTLLRFVDGLFNVNVPIEMFLLFKPLSETPTPFSFNLASIFLLIGVALLLPYTRLTDRIKWMQLALLIVVMIAGIAVLGYVYGVEVFYNSIIGAPLSFTTALLALLISLSILHPTRHDGILNIITATTSGGMFIRRILPVIIVSPHIFALLLLHLMDEANFSFAAGTASCIIIAEVFVIGALWRTSQNIDKIERERETISQKLRESEERYRKLFEQSNDTILIIDENNHYIDVNPQAEKLLGYSRSELLNMSIADLTFTEYQNAAQDLYRLLQTNGSAQGEAIFKLKDEREMNVAFTSNRIAPGIYQAVLHDITSYKQIEENLRNALKQEHELNEMKSRFVSMLSHEFRTPLSIIRTSSDILDRYGYRFTDGQRKEYFANVQTQVTHMVQLLEDVLTISKSSAIGIEFTPEFTELNAFCRQIIDEFQMTTATHLIIFKSTQQVIAANIDRKLLRQALNNLLSNALKYSPDKDRIIVELDCQSGYVRLRVQDFGIGIPVEDQARMFEHFHRARNVGDIFGTGLGLAIVKEAVEAHGGTINFSSAEGTTFTITLPQPAPTITDIQQVRELHPTDLN